MSEDEAERRHRAEGELHTWLWEYVTDKFFYVRRLGADGYRVADEEETPEDYRDDDTLLILRREDGALFEVDLWVDLRPVHVKPAEEAPHGQED